MTEAERKLLLLVAEQVSVLTGKQVDLAEKENLWNAADRLRKIAWTIDELTEEVETKEGRE